MGFLKVLCLGLYFLFYILTIFLKLSDKSNSVLFTSDMSMINKNSSPMEFRDNINVVFREINEWFPGNLLSLDYDKTYFFAICN